MDRKKKVAGGLLWTSITNIVNAVYGFIAVPILIEHYGKDEYGLIGLAMSINVYLQLMDMGFNSTNIRFFSVWQSSGEESKLSKAFSSSLSFYGLIGLINALVLVIVAIFSEHIFDVTATQNVVLRHMLIILAISAFLNWYSSCFDQLIKSTENVAWVQRRSLIPKLIQILLLIIVIKVDMSLTLYFALTTFAFVSILPLSVSKIHKLLPYISFKPKWNWAILKEMLPYSLGIFGYSIFQFSFYNLRPVFLGIESSLGQVADYRILNGILGIVTMFAGMFIGVLLPSTSKIIAEHNKNAYDTVAYDGTKYITIIVSFCSFGIMSVGPELLTAYVGAQYLYLIPALNLWLICALGTHNQAISSLVLAGDNLRPIAINSAIASVVGLASAWFMIPSMGVMGTIWAFAIYLAIQLGFYYLYYWPKKMEINSWRVFYYGFVPPVCVGVLSYFITRFFNLHLSGYPGLVLIGLEFAVIYGIATLLILNKKDRSFLKQIIRRKG